VSDAIGWAMLVEKKRLFSAVKAGALFPGHPRQGHENPVRIRQRRGKDDRQHGPAACGAEGERPFAQTGRHQPQQLLRLRTTIGIISIPRLRHSQPLNRFTAVPPGRTQRCHHDRRDTVQHIGGEPDGRRELVSGYSAR